MLIDTGALHFFISYQFSRALRLRVESMMPPLTVTTPISQLATLRDVCRSCILDIIGCTTEFYLVVLHVTEFNIIIRMVWLSAF